VAHSPPWWHLSPLSQRAWLEVAKLGLDEYVGVGDEAVRSKVRMEPMADACLLGVIVLLDNYLCVIRGMDK